MVAFGCGGQISGAWMNRNRGVDLMSDALPFGRLWHVEVSACESFALGFSDASLLGHEFYPRFRTGIAVDKVLALAGQTPSVNGNTANIPPRTLGGAAERAKCTEH